MKSVKLNKESNLDNIVQEIFKRLDETEPYVDVYEK